MHPGKRTRESRVYVLGGSEGKKTRARSNERDREQGEEHDGGKESWGLTWLNNHSKMKLFPFITQTIHVLIRRFS